MNKKTKLIIVALLLIFLPASVYISQKVVDYQKRAGVNQVGLSILPSEKDISPGGIIDLKVNLDTGNNKVDAIDLNLEITGPEGVLDWQKTKIIPITGSDEAFDQSVKAEVGELSCEQYSCSQPLRLISVVSRSEADLESGVFDAARIQLVGYEEGDFEVKFISQDTIISGPAGKFEVSSVINGKYSVSPGEGQRQVNLVWNPEGQSQVVVNKPFYVYLNLQSENLIDAAEIGLKYDSSQLGVELVSLNKSAWGDDQEPAYIFAEEVDKESEIINLGIGAGSSKFSKSEMSFATLRLKPLTTGTISLEVIKDDISGYNPTSPSDSALTLVSGKTVSWNSVQAGDNPELTFRVKFNGTTYLIGGQEKIVDNIPPQPVDVVIKKGDFVEEFKTVVNFDDQAVGTGSLILDNVPPGDGYVLFVKGPVHLGNRYCFNNQSERCHLGENNISLKSGENVFDWTNHQLQPGDINRDRVVNSLDFSLLKKALGREGSQIQEDLNFNGFVNTQDIVFFLETLSFRYEDEI